MTSPSLPRRGFVTAGAAGLLALTAQPAAHALTGGPPSTRRPGGSLVLVGGALRRDNSRVLGEIVARAGGPRARIGVLTAASVPASQDPHRDDPERCNNSECNGAYYVDLLTRHGAGEARWIPVDLDHVANADDEDIAHTVASMTGFFLGGGDQFRYVTTLLNGAEHTDTRVMAALRRRFAEGAVVAGTSAGAQITSGPHMVTGGESYEGLRDGSAPGWFADATVLGHWPAGGFGFLAAGLIDTHSSAYGREGRALRLASDTGHDRVLCLEENTALVVDHAGTARERLRVVGEHGVAVLDLRRARAHQGPDGWSLDGARYSYLTDRARYLPDRWHATPPPGARPLRPTGSEPVPPNDDVFYSRANPDGEPYSFLGTARALAQSRTHRSATATTWEDDPRFTVTLSKGPRFRAWTHDGSTAHTLLDLDVAIAPR
ncbi:MULTISPECIES: cyanophycinase [unclassified Streptomyces]|uniref:cyanophycinase n=1 Tax=unclassified Streptomyces TaxID=2593676 RepID=UPI0022B727C5|nr:MULTISPECIES: cyanophycinase [unclassified Streptomyces]MCZ7415292.1 cyanophycinase [Streptomyces sp. WMMC897]MCZ7432233.1 cyanophycinase [Streptomyces sp. WMMC1477]